MNYKDEPQRLTLWFNRCPLNSLNGCFRKEPLRKQSAPVETVLFPLKSLNGCFRKEPLRMQSAPVETVLFLLNSLNGCFRKEPLRMQSAPVETTHSNLQNYTNQTAGALVDYPFNSFLKLQPLLLRHPCQLSLQAFAHKLV